MAIFYLDSDNGNDVNAGTSWALAWKTVTSGATSARTAAGDTIRIAKSPDPTSLGQTAKWTGLAAANPPSTTSITATANNGSGLIQITSASHGLATNDVVQIQSIVGTVEANSVWLVTLVSATQFDLQGSTYVNAWVSGGTVRKINHRAVVLTSAVTQTVDNCDVNWTAGAQTTSATTDSATYPIYFREGSAAIKIVTAATCNANQIIAYHGLPASLNLSGYQQISFWICNNTLAMASGDLQIRLYSDAACTTLVETLSIAVALPNYGSWTPVTINKGSALSATVQGIAVYTTVQFDAKTVFIDNFIACKSVGSADSLTLSSLISKNTLAVTTTASTSYGNEPWIAIQSIKDRIVILDGWGFAAVISANDASRGYYGVTETVTTYKRETTKPRYMAIYQADVQEGGNFGSPITYSGGWNTGTTVQDGETYFDNGGEATGIVMWSRGFVYWERVNLTRCRQAFFYSFGGKNNISASNLCNCRIGILHDAVNSGGCVHTLINNSHCYTGVWWSNSDGSTLTVYRSNSHDGYSATYCGNSKNQTLTLYEVMNNKTSVWFIDKSHNCTINYINTNYGGSYAVGWQQSRNGNLLAGTIGSTFSNAGIYASEACPLYIRNTANAAATTISQLATLQSNDKIYITKYNNTANDHRTMNGSGATTMNISTDGTTRHTPTGVSWRLYASPAERAVGYPVNLVIARIACAASSLVTVRAWFMKSNATGIGAKMLIRGKQIAGVDADLSVTKSDNTTWELLTLSFTPTASGIVEVEALAWYISSAYFIYVDDISVTQI